jgi:hypothetical protein
MNRMNRLKKKTHRSLEGRGGNHTAQLSVLVDMRPAYEHNNFEILLICSIDLWVFQKESSKTRKNTPMHECFCKPAQTGIAGLP